MEVLKGFYFQQTGIAMSNTILLVFRKETLLGDNPQKSCFCVMHALQCFTTVKHRVMHKTCALQL